eukprot:13592511-Alexandrium_andersonii.AAC.1
MHLLRVREERSRRGKAGGALGTGQGAGGAGRNRTSSSGISPFTASGIPGGLLSKTSPGLRMVAGEASTAIKLGRGKSMPGFAGVQQQPLHITFQKGDPILDLMHESPQNRRRRLPEPGEEAQPGNAYGEMGGPDASVLKQLTVADGSNVGNARNVREHARKPPVYAIERAEGLRGHAMPSSDIEVEDGKHEGITKHGTRLRRNILVLEGTSKLGKRLTSTHGSVAGFWLARTISSENATKML